MLRDKLIVSQTGEVHQQVAEFLATLEEAQQVIAAAGGKPPKVTSLPQPAGIEGEIEKVLSKPAQLRVSSKRR